MPALSVGRKRAPHSCPCIDASTDVSSQCIPRSFCLNKPDETSSPSQFRSLIFVASIDRYQPFPEGDKGPHHTASPSRASCAQHAAAGTHCRVNTQCSVPSLSFCRLSGTVDTGCQENAPQDSGWHVSLRCSFPNPPDSACSLTLTKLRSTGKKHLVGPPDLWTWV